MAVIWNSGDASANVTLSGGSLVATMSSATQGAVRGNTSFAAGKLYFEATLTNLSGSAWSVGWANSAAALGTAMGTDTKSVVYRPNQGGQAFFNNGALGTDYFPSVGDTVCVAFDIGALKIWFKVNNGLWNGSATADPATGAGGYSVATIAAGPYFPVFGDAGSGGAVTARFGATDFWFAIPSGFSGLDTNAQAFNAASKFLGYAELAPPQNAVSASKFVGYAELAPPRNAVSASKVVGYALLREASPSFSRLAEPTKRAAAIAALAAGLFQAPFVGAAVDDDVICTLIF